MEEGGLGLRGATSWWGVGGIPGQGSTRERWKLLGRKKGESGCWLVDKLSLPHFDLSYYLKLLYLLLKI